jgi:hypothetical protein
MVTELILSLDFVLGDAIKFKDVNVKLDDQ